ncbi:hypothetical protein PLICRDRAFT_83984, partial [Plicaturopsis crispa FD-325 SS-3]
DNPLLMWIPLCDEFLDEVIRHEGRGGFTDELCSCGAATARFRCKDCVGHPALLCKECVLAMHAHSPYHALEDWNGRFFEKRTLKELGLRIQLGHPVGARCPQPEPAFGDDFVILDTERIHAVLLDFCGCERRESKRVQLLRHRLFPATVANPKTAVSFRLLEHYDLLALETKISAFGYYRALALRTDITGLHTPKARLQDRYSVFLRIIREWQYLAFLKRSGRGHDPGGHAGTKDGELAIICPACPQPGINLPDGWKDAPAPTKWIYTLYLGIDANFRMVRKLVSNITVDPSLVDGKAYLVARKDYMEHVLSYPEQPNTCVAHDAIQSANGKNSRGLDTTGLGNVVCTRHDMCRKNAMGDLQKGEKYCNMDYLVLSTLEGHGLARIVLSYDIACQWHINLAQRMEAYPSSKQLNADGSLSLVYLVPAFHLPAHRSACHTDYSHALTRWIGHCEGEAPERLWEKLDPLAPSTKEMGPGSRYDKLTFHIAHSNWKKISGLGISLLRKMKDAIPEQAEHTWEFQQLTETLPEDAVASWTGMVERWEEDNKLQNPFNPTVKTPTQADVRHTLAESEARDIISGTSLMLHDTISPAQLISTGLDLEGQQCRLRFDRTKGTGLHPTSAQLASLTNRSTLLHRKILAWRAIQALYMPQVARLLHRSTESAGKATEEVYNMHLYLPSEVETAVPCDNKLREYEWDLRIGQGYETLAELRRHLRLRSHLYKSKDADARGQRLSTRANVIIGRVTNQIEACAKAYRVARAALLALGPILGKSEAWKRILCELEDTDIRHMSGGLYEEETQTSSRRNLSWIWLIQGVPGQGDDITTDPIMSDALRIEWCCARARAMRWSEEIILLQEEMRRVKVTMEWQAVRWDSRAA